MSTILIFIKLVFSLVDLQSICSLFADCGYLRYLQTINVVILFLDAYYRILPAIWFVFMIIFWEGLLGGGIYEYIL